MKLIKKVAIGLFLSLLALFLLKAEVKAEAEYVPIASNQKYSMEFNEKTANVRITNKATGSVWTTFPEDWEEDSMSKGAVKENIASHLLLDLYGTKDNTISVNTYTHCVKKGLFTYDILSDGLAINYDFTKQGILITLEFHLTENGFTVVVPPSKVVEGDTIVANISILPFLCTGVKGEEGYLFVPDGSGMLVDFQDNFELYRNLIRPIYGRDYATNIPSSNLIEENYRLPVYGVKNQDTGVFAIIETQEARASITTGISGFMYGRFRNYPTMIYRDENKISITNNDGVTTFYTRWSDPIKDDIKISYYLLDKEQSDYSDMAAIYQNYLTKENKLKKNIKSGASFDLTLIGSIRTKKTFLGIPITANTSLTTFKQAEKIIDSLQNRGIENINVRYLGFNNKGYLNQWTESINPLFSLGGKGGLKKLVEFSKNSNTNLFLSGELIQVYNNGNGFSANKDAVRTISNSVLQVFDYSIVTGNLLKGQNGRYLTTPRLFSDVFSKYLNQAKGYSVDSIAFEDVGSLLYSDYNKNNRITREKSQSFLEDALNIPENIENVMFTGGNAYVFDQATHLTEVPLTGSNHQIASEYVPFYQMVIHGYINYSGKAFNFSNNRQKDILKMIEYGANVHYYGIYKESSAIKNSKLNYVLSPCYKDWISEASEIYRKMSIAYDGIYNRRMIDHYKLEDDVYITVYEGGASIIVNYREEEFRYNRNIVVNGMDFMVVEGGSYEK